MDTINHFSVTGIFGWALFCNRENLNLWYSTCKWLCPLKPSRHVAPPQLLNVQEHNQKKCNLSHVTLLYLCADTRWWNNGVGNDCLLGSYIIHLRNNKVTFQVHWVPMYQLCKIIFGFGLDNSVSLEGLGGERKNKVSISLSVYTSGPRRLSSWNRTCWKPGILSAEQKTSCWRLPARLSMW